MSAIEMNLRVQQEIIAEVRPHAQDFFFNPQ
jgi:hypothetical protein